MFRGDSKLTIDVKGRIAIPTKYREILHGQSEGQIVITININPSERCLWLYTQTEWNEIEQKLVNLPSLDSKAQRLKRILMGHASDAELDGNGRILLPTTLREFAGLEKHVLLIGQGNKFEIWNEMTWNEQREKWLSADLVDGTLSVEMESLSL